VVLIVPAAVMVFLLDLAQRNADDHDVILTWRPVAQGLVYATFLLGVVVFSGGPTIPFIYFQF
jgi:hypothetical protein